MISKGDECSVPAGAVVRGGGCPPTSSSMSSRGSGGGVWPCDQLPWSPQQLGHLCVTSGQQVLSSRSRFLPRRIVLQTISFHLDGFCIEVSRCRLKLSRTLCRATVEALFTDQPLRSRQRPRHECSHSEMGKPPSPPSPARAPTDVGRDGVAAGRDAESKEQRLTLTRKAGSQCPSGDHSISLRL